jgi:pimeloyl-ACP methyl ester carboxylesterase
VIAGAGHWVHAEKPKEFFEVVLRFLKSWNI